MRDNYRFQILGPFRVPVDAARKNRRRRIDCEHAREAVFEDAQKVIGSKYDICESIGCYVFGMNPPGGPKTWPYYVGKACDQTLYNRVFQPPSKPRIYNQILDEFDRGRPFIYLLPLVSPGGGLAQLGSANNSRRISLAEEQLIGMALRVNPDLWNVQHRKALESFTIDGISKTPGKPSGSAQRFRTMIDRPPPRQVRANAPDASEPGAAAAP